MSLQTDEIKEVCFLSFLLIGVASGLTIIFAAVRFLLY